MKKGLKINRFFTHLKKTAFQEFKYVKREARIQNSNGKSLFEMSEVEVPESWSQNATNILADKFLRKANVPKNISETGQETSIKQIVHRLVDCWRYWGEKYHYFASKEDAETFYQEVSYMILGQYAAPNSPQWFNTGLYNSYKIKGKAQGHYYVDPDSQEVKASTSAYERPQPHACFILSVDDDLVNENGIMDLWVREARIFKYGSGVGTNFSTIRGAGEKLSGGGYSSGLMSFLKIGDRAAGAIKSGGTTRRAAKMVCLDLDHPEVEKFIDWKVEEEKKVEALMKAGFSAGFEGDAYNSVSGQNSNNSIRISNEFFDHLDEQKSWALRSRKDNRVVKTIPAKELWEKITYSAWKCADPGIQYDTTINQWHTCPKGGKINASNPCSEYMFLDNTACNLASLNLVKFYQVDKDKFDYKAFEHACRLLTIVLDISVLMAQFPSKQVALNSYQYRTLGLGYTNLGTLLMLSGIPYDSEKGRALCAVITSIMHGAAYLTSAEMAATLSPFQRYMENKEDMMRIIRNHSYAIENKVDQCEGLTVLPQPINEDLCPEYLLCYSRKLWNKVVKNGENYGFRNAQVTVIAPTGTISFLMDCDTTGIEPDFALVKYKSLAGGGSMKLINNSVSKVLHKLNYNSDQIIEIVQYVIGNSNLNKSPHINKDSLMRKGFGEKEINILIEKLKNSFHISDAFQSAYFSDDFLNSLGFTRQDVEKIDFNLLEKIGFTPEQIAQASEYLCGTKTIEGAPYLKKEHYAIFDCANNCGEKGTRFIKPEGHIRMMAVAQPFISGSISKTINLPNSASVEDISDCYKISWELGLKSNAIFRDGSKLSQPLSTSNNKKEHARQETEINKETILELAKQYIDQSKDTTFKRALSKVVNRKSLKSKRMGYTHKLKIGHHTLYLHTGHYEDHTLGEIFIDMHKEGSTLGGMMNCFAIAISIGLQYGVPLREFVHKFKQQNFEPKGHVFGYEQVKRADSIVDCIFKILEHEYLINPSKEEVIIQKEDQSKVNSVPESIPTVDKKIARVSGLISKYTKEKVSSVEGNVKLEPKPILTGIQSSNQVCPNCGHMMVPNAACYVCPNCGTSGGCG